MGVTIRKIELTDAARVAQLSESLGYPSSAEQIAQRIERLDVSSHDLLLAAELDARVVGWLHAHDSCSMESGPRVEIVGLIVDEGYRKAGVGRALVAAAETWAWSNGAPCVVVRTNVVRQESHSFYHALGFAATKTQQVFRKQRPL